MATRITFLLNKSVNTYLAGRVLFDPRGLLTTERTIKRCNDKTHIEVVELISYYSVLCHIINHLEVRQFLPQAVTKREENVFLKHDILSFRLRCE